MFAGGVFQDVFIDPAHPGGVGTQGRVHPRGQFAPDKIQIFQHPGPGPVDVGAVFEDDIDQGQAEQGIAPHRLGLGHGQHGGGQGIGHLVLHHLGGLAGVIGGDDHLDVGEVGDGVHRQFEGGVNAPGGDQEPNDQHQDPVADTGFDESGDHEVSFRRFR